MAPVAAATPVPAVPPPATERRERQASWSCGRGRARGTWVENGPSKPILSGDDAKTSDSEEAMSQHLNSFESESDDADSGFESGGDAEESSKAESDDDTSSGSGSNSDNGAGGDSAPESSPPKKRMKRASRAWGDQL